jgi:hypothetical protein
MTEATKVSPAASSSFGHFSLGFGFVVSSAERSFAEIIREEVRE